MKRTLINTISLSLLILSSLASAGCSKEKYDFIPEPTATSVIVTGRVISNDGTPLANVPVGVDFHESQYLTYVKTIHKATGQTDANGNFRMFFEPEKSKDNPQLHTYYIILADLSQIPSDKYILPSELDSPFAGNSDVVPIYCSDFKEGESVSEDFLIPRKKTLTIQLENYASGDALTVSNTIKYCNRYVTISSPVVFSSGNSASATINCAIDETNSLTVVRDRDSEVLDSQDVQVTSSTDRPVIFNNTI